MTQTENEYAHQRPRVDDDIDLRKLFRSIWDGKWLVGTISFAGTVIAVIVALMLPNFYQAEALLAPTQDSRAGHLATLSAQYGELASLAGINLADGSLDKTTLGLEILKSRKFISEFIKHHDILAPLMAAKSWDEDTEELKIDSGIYDVVAMKWVRAVSPPRKVVPSQQEAYEKFIEDVLSVEQDKTTGFITIGIEHYSPIVAKQWVDWLVQDINATVMQQDVDKAEQAIKYLQEQITATSLAGLQNIFFRLMEEQTKTVMLARVSPEYMFRTIDPAVAPEIKAGPKRSLIAFLGMILSGMISIAIILGRKD